VSPSGRLPVTDERGFVVVTAILLIAVMATIGLAVVQFADTQQSQAGLERVRESAFQLTEGAMQSQVFELGREWPGTPGSALPATGCTPTTGSASRCPDGPALAAAYSGADYQVRSCPTGTPQGPWTTRVSDNGTNTLGDARQYYARAVVEGSGAVPPLPSWDANADGKVWVRAQGVSNCRVQTQVALIAQTLETQAFPRNTLTANWLRTTNNGLHGDPLITTRDPREPQPSKVSLRCDPGSPTPCADYQPDKGQIYPDTKVVETGTSPTMTVAQIDSFRAQAKAAGTYYPAGVCPGDLGGRTPGNIAFAENPGGFGSNGLPACRLTGGGFTNASPGFLVVASGAIAIGGNDVFYGLVYAANLGNLTGPVVSLTGTAGIKGAVTIDGPGGLFAGASGGNVTFDGRGFGLVKGTTGAGIVRNSFRILPTGL
jgi:Tfp pilus assembly protein PilX